MALPRWSASCSLGIRMTEEKDARRWYVIHTYSGYEERVKRNLKQRIESMDAQNQIFQVIIPTEKEIEVREGQKRTVKRKIFPGYLMVEMVMDDKSWNVVRNTPAVTGFVSAQDSEGKLVPVPLEEEKVQQVKKQMESEVPRVKVGFTKGQSVRIVDGPFIDFVGVVDEVSPEKGKVKVLVSFFGRETPVELDFLQAERL